MKDAGLTMNCGLLEVIEFTENAAVPMLDTVNIRVADDPTGMSPNEREVADREMASSVPDSDTVEGLSGAL